MEQRLLKENVFKALMIFALPYMFSNLLQVLYGSADLFVVGQYLGSKPYRDLSKMIGGAIVLFLIIALGLTFVMLYFNNEITLLMNTPKEAIEATKS